MLLRFIAIPAIEIQDKEFSLPYVLHCGVAEAGKRVLYGLSLRIKYGVIWHDPDVCFHECSITSALAGSGAARFAGGRKRVLESHFDDAGKFVLPKSHAGGVFVFLMQGCMEHRGVVGGEDNGYSVAQELRQWVILDSNGFLLEL